MKNLSIFIAVLVVIITVIMGLKYNNQAQTSQAELNQERYLRMSAEESLEKANSKITSLEGELSRAQNKLNGLEKRLEQAETMNTDLKARLDKAAEINEGIKKQIQVLEDISATQPAQATGGL